MLTVSEHRLESIYRPLASPGYRTGTPEAVVREEFFAFGPPAWNASEAIACAGGDCIEAVRSTHSAGGSKAENSRRLDGIWISPTPCLYHAADKKGENTRGPGTASQSESPRKTNPRIILPFDMSHPSTASSASIMAAPTPTKP